MLSVSNVGKNWLSAGRASGVLRVDASKVNGDYICVEVGRCITGLDFGTCTCYSVVSLFFINTFYVKWNRIYGE